MVRRYGLIHISFIAVLGVAGWGVLLYQTVLPQAFFAPIEFSAQALAAFLLMAAARMLSFRIFRRARIALDSAFYIACKFALGTLTTGWLLAIALTIDGVVNLARGRGPVAKGEAPLRHTVSHLVMTGGLPCLVLILGSGAFGGDQAVGGISDGTLLWFVPAYALTFLGLHYFLAGATSWFHGATSATLWRDYFLRVVSAEITLVPLSLAMVLAYKHQGIGLFLLLGATGVLFGGIFRRMVRVGESLHNRVDELSAINRIGRIISDSYDQQSLFKNLSVASLQLVGHGSLFLIGLIDELGENVGYELYNERGECLKQIVAGTDDGLSGWVMKNKKGLCLGDIQREYLDYAGDGRYNDERYHSWLGVPLVVYGEVVGVMSVQSEVAHAYTLNHLRVLTTIGDQAAVAIENSRLYQLATVDGLTGLFVRRYFDQRLVEEYHRTGRYGNPFCLGLFDLDRFKQLNDTHGHQVGDQVLRESARAVRDNMRSFDVAARYGGEEFAFILPRTSLEDAQRVAERIRRDVEKIRVPTAEGEVGVTTSIGVAQYPSDNIHEVGDLIARADEALYRAKSEGRNRVLLADGARPMVIPAAEAGGTL